MSEEQRNGRTNIILAFIAVVVVAIVAVISLQDDEEASSIENVLESQNAALASEHAPLHGNPDAKVHIVEFLDPACGTCAIFYPMVKGWMEQVPGELKLSVRHVPFHDGAEYVVQVLEASRKQGKYWETLETLLARQSQWTRNHVVLAEMVDPAIADVGLDMEKLKADMNSIDVIRNMEQDQKDAVFLRISKTPTYFVNGRPLPSFGAQQLADLIREELEKQR
ncbi:MAG: thioredoxin domain-containing protein [Woeseiaceae bacterium]|nr:thioredoxin domain-containing protein [Woeseiaceae bacterium]